MQSGLFLTNTLFCRINVIAALLTASAFAQTSLTLSSVPGSTGSSNFSVSASIPSGSNLALLQWQFTFSPSSIASLAVTAGPALTAAGKTLTCGVSAGIYSCIAYGLNNNLIASGVLANVTATLTSAASAGIVTLGSALGATATGEPFTISSSGATVNVAAATTATVTALTCGNTSLGPGGATSCTVSLSAPVAGSTAVPLSTTSAALTIPASVVVPAGASSASFNLIAADFSTSQTASLSAALNGATQTVSLSLLAPASLSSFQCATTSLAANTTTACTIGLSAAAPSTGALVALSSNSSGVSIPASVTVPAGATSVSFTATATLAVSQNTPVTLTASMSTNMGSQSLSTSLTITGSAAVMTIWSPSAVPSVPWVATAGPLTVGLRFRSDVSGTVTGARFYKGSSNTGTHIGLLYSSTGTLLAQATFTGETASGWQQVNFSAPVPVAANTVYIVALYTTSGCAYDAGYFAAKGVDNGYLHALQSTSTSGNGVYTYGNNPVFPSLSVNGSNYWVDVAFTTASSSTTPPPSPAPAPTVSGSGADTLWAASATPAVPWVATAGALTVGLKFYSDTAGTVTGARFYKGLGSGNGTHIGLLYSSTGQLLAQAAFTNETASGWQQVNFATPVPIAANTTYVIALYTDSGCAYDAGYFTGKGVDNAPLHAQASSSTGGNGVYIYSNAPAFPSLTSGDANYWVDLAFAPATN
jgi:hypothetical protein